MLPRGVLRHIGGSPRTRSCVFYVRRSEDTDLAELSVPSRATIGALKAAACAALRLDAPLSAVTLSREGAALDCTLTLDEAHAAGVLAPRDKLVAVVRAVSGEGGGSPLLEGGGSPLLLPYRVLDESVETEPQLLASDAEFQHFVRGRTLWAVRDKSEGGGSKRSMITSLRAARGALATAGTYLLLREGGDMLEVDVSNLKRAGKNASTSFEQLANKAVASDSELRRRCGELEPVNNGEAVVFVDKRTGKDFASFDGLFLCPDGGRVLFNESKQRLDKGDVGVVRSLFASLSMVCKDPARFPSRPADVSKLIAGRTVVPLLSCTACDAETAAVCVAAHIHVLVRNGDGFACSLAVGEFAASSGSV